MAAQASTSCALSAAGSLPLTGDFPAESVVASPNHDNSYIRRIPSFWSDSLRDNDITSNAVELYATLIHSIEDNPLTFRPVVLLSLAPLPVEPFVPMQELKSVLLKPCSSFIANIRTINELHIMTYHLWRYITSKADGLGGALRHTRYFIAPLVDGFSFTEGSGFPNLLNDISWVEMLYVRQRRATLDESIVDTLRIVPDVLLQIDHLLVVREASLNLFDMPVDAGYLRSALAPRLRDHNLLARLGSSICQYMITVFVFGTHQEADTALLDQLRGHLTSKDRLFQQAEALDLPPYIFKGVGPLDFYPAGPVRTRSRDHRHGTRQFSRQTIINCVYGLVAAAYLSRTALGDVHKLARKFGAYLPAIHDWKSTFRQWGIFEIGEQAPLAEGAQFILSFHVTVRKGLLLDHAFREHSIGWSGCRDRYKWLGRPVLEILSTEFVIERYPDLSTDAASTLVESMLSDATLAALCVVQTFHTFVERFDEEIIEQINNYAQIAVLARGFEALLSEFMGRLESQYWSPIIMPFPQLLADLVPAIAGALVASDDFQLDSVRTFFRQALLPFYVDYYPGGIVDTHLTAELMGHVLGRGCRQFDWGPLPEHPNEAGFYTAHVRFHGVLFHSEEGRTKNAAVELCAYNALQRLREDPLLIGPLCQCI
ncbi:hypothetical protein BOTBODRAFT_53536 [Botryobasidium botryosum FD-172 SS1]|uniref:RNase III domain-containing protein n=1 Tax=Botryobasidium botryosum (strain FD-172 SS1) TaxID=930990 RepID=A0A067MZE2_BOTB1|nr:hypothetical protein BOTBODRAFT_53536 [Botryobasidium botryosum FD-172 SS1]